MLIGTFMVQSRDIQSIFLLGDYNGASYISVESLKAKTKTWVIKQYKIYDNKVFDVAFKLVIANVEFVDKNLHY